MELLRVADMDIPDGLCLTQTGNNSRCEEDLHIDEDQNDGPPPDEPDTIEQLTEPTKCSLVDCGGCDMELALAAVYPNQQTCHLIVQLRYLPEDCLIILNLFWSTKIEMNISGEKEKKIGIVDMCKYK